MHTLIWSEKQEVCPDYQKYYLNTWGFNCCSPSFHCKPQQSFNLSRFAWLKARGLFKVNYQQPFTVLITQIKWKGEKYGKNRPWRHALTSRDRLSWLHNFIPAPFAQGFYQIAPLHASLSVLQGSATTDIAGQQLPKCAHENISMIKVVAGSTWDIWEDYP